MSTQGIKLFLGALIIIVIIGFSYFTFLLKAKELDEKTEFSLSEGIMNRFQFQDIGLKPGDTIQEMTLFDHNKGTGISLRKILGGTKSNVIISGSYTCDVTRSQVNSIDSMYNLYQSNYDFFFIHTIEAHPVNSQSPYSADTIPWEARRNIEAGVQASQPTTLGEREELSGKLIKEENIQMPILIDNVKNEFWKNIGQGPNMAVVVSTEGIILHKEPWFDANELGAFLEQ